MQVLSEWILHDKSLALTKNALAEPTVYSLDEENRRRFPVSPAYDVLITLVNPDPEKLKIVWNLRTMTEGTPYELINLRIINQLRYKTQTELCKIFSRIFYINSRNNDFRPSSQLNDRICCRM